jgi:putative Mg2+ transporter-C (MgtC) family protein
VTFTVHYPEELWILVQVLIAMLLGGALGWEREATGKWAGFRTHMLVCVATMLFVRLGQVLIADSAARFPGNYLRTDPTRMIEAIAVGISFIGAGTIFRGPNETRKKGLTTAASLLTTAPIGLAIALNRYIVAVGVTLICLFILHTLHRLEERIGTARREPPANVP